MNIQPLLYAPINFARCELYYTIINQFGFQIINVSVTTYEDTYNSNFVYNTVTMYRYRANDTFHACS